MKFNISNLELKLQKALKILSNDNLFEISGDGLEIKYIKVEANEISAILNNNILVIKASDYPGFFKAFSEYLRTGKEYITKRAFKKLGMMVDNSRNGVTNVEFTKEAIKKIAFMGHNTFYLYIEDTYLLDNHEYFGYLRGGYTKEELKEMDDYADIFGVELVPCIQTLAHINQFFMWEHIPKDYADIDDILCVGNPKVLELIEDMIKNFRETLRTRRIHLGMDEAYNLGRGFYADKNGLKEKPYIMLEHLENLMEICKKYEMQPMIWDDMFFTNYSKLSEKDSNFYLPDGLGLMYWDYYNSSVDHYIERINMRKGISNDVSFAGGAWRWVGYTPHHSKTLFTLSASMKACIKEGINEVLITTWSDDSTECPFFNMYLGALKAAENAYGSDDVKEKCKFYIGLEYDEYLSLEKLDAVENTDNDFTPSKYWLYEDPLMSKFVYHTEKIKEDFTKKYEDLKNSYKQIANKYLDNKEINDIYNMYSVYADILSKKWNLALNLYNLYRSKDIDKLKLEIEKIDELIKLIPEFAKLRKSIWYRELKRYGFEILDQRFGGIIQRLISTKEDLINHINNGVIISELEEKRIALSPEFKDKDIIVYNRAQRSVSASRMTW